ncbi:MAG: GAF domain-containing protein [Candidatus Nanohaloarchaea archaeon]|nr:GAF domain-containing protein [Candidatus Nanohaloarchaea archaeon]
MLADGSGINPSLYKIDTIPMTGNTDENDQQPVQQSSRAERAYSEEQRSITAERYLVGENATLEDLASEAADEFDVDRAAVRILTQAEQHTVASTQMTRQTISRSDAICRHTIMLDKGMVIDDLTAHPEFASSPVVREDGMQWYAGAPIFVEGHPIGTFCIEDHNPGRDLLTAERNVLQSYAQRAATVLAFRHHRQERDAGIEEAVAKALAAGTRT